MTRIFVMGIPSSMVFLEIFVIAYQLNVWLSNDNLNPRSAMIFALISRDDECVNNSISPLRFSESRQRPYFPGNAESEFGCQALFVIT
jgi:hypothetical protein